MAGAEIRSDGIGQLTGYPTRQVQLGVGGLGHLARVRGLQWDLKNATGDDFVLYIG